MSMKVFGVGRERGRIQAYDKMALWDPNISLTVTFSLPTTTSTGRRPSHPISATVAPRLSTMMVLRVTVASLSLSVSESFSSA